MLKGVTGMKPRPVFALAAAAAAALVILDG